MYYNDFYPDGLTKEIIDGLIAEAYESADEAATAPVLLDGTAARRRSRRIARQTVGGVVRTMPVSRVTVPSDGRVA